MLSQSFAINSKDRLATARKNRQQQLDRWDRFETESNIKILSKEEKENHIKISRNIQFSNEIVLLEAISRNDIKEVTELLKKGVNPNSATVDGLTGLHQCCIEDYLEMGTVLLKYNANVNAVDSEMWTPLHAAATCGNDEMCKLLIKFGANFLSINADGNMPYDICDGANTLSIIETEMSKQNITQEQIDQARLIPENIVMNIVKEMIKERRNLEELDNQGATLLHIACSLGFIEVVRTLLDAGASHSTADKEGWLPIHISACWNYVDIVETLVAFGANIDDPNVVGDTVFDICEPQFRERLMYIKNNVETIRNNFDFNRRPQSKSFRKSRGSSIRRSSVRHKTMISRKEAKEEFLTMNQPAINHCPLVDSVNDEDNSDIDNCVFVPTVKQNNIEIPKHEIITPNKPEPQTNIPPNSTHIIYSKTSDKLMQSPKKATRAPPPPKNEILSTTNNNSTANLDISDIDEVKPITIKEVQLHDNSMQSRPVANNGIDALNQPRYIYSSTTENWDIKNDSKKSGKRGCCVFL